MHQIGGVPEHFLQFVAHKISRPQSLPQLLLRLFGCAGVVQQFERALLAAAHHHGAVAAFARQIAAGGVEKVLQQIGFPVVPQFGVGAADIGHGEQIKRGEPLLRLHTRAKALDYNRVLNVFFLGGGRHQ